MRKFTFCTLTTFVLMTTAFTLAGDWHRNHVERVQDEIEIRQDHGQRVDDLRDLVRMTSLAHRFEAARDRNDIDSLQQIDNELRIAVARELHEGRIEVVQSKAEARRSEREVRASRRELRREKRRRAPAHEVRDDRRDLRDDVRDRNDDLRDLRLEAKTMARRVKIAKKLEKLIGRYDNPALDKRSMLMRELIHLARTENRQNNRELREDRRERREDRRERREDRHGGL